jgi:DNA-binding NtrC family response regulator
MDKVLIVDDERDVLLGCEVTLRSSGFTDVLACNDSRSVMDLMERHEIGAVILDLWMPHVSGEELLVQIRERHPGVPVIVLTGANDVDTAVRCMQAGAFDYFVKPAESGRLTGVLRRALDLRALEAENARLRQHFQEPELQHPEAFSHFITVNPKIHGIFRYLETIAQSPKPILITGETGVGKEVLAKATHALTGTQRPFVTVNVAGLDDHMFSDTLFGHTKGAFTGANAARAGLIESARGGTLFLDEIGDLNMASQVKLLRLLQDKEYLPLGSDTPRIADAKILAGTNRDLHRMQGDGSFRKDLYYRLQAHHVEIPPLRERHDDLSLLLYHFLDLAANALKRKKPAVPRELPTLLSTYHFPGNVRELEAMVFEALSRHSGGVLSLDSFKEHMSRHENGRVQAMPNGNECSDAPIAIPAQFPTLKDATDYLVEEAMRRAQGNQTIAARMLGISRPALNKRLHRQPS